MDVWVYVGDTISPRSPITLRTLVNFDVDKPLQDEEAQGRLNAGPRNACTLDNLIIGRPRNVRGVVPLRRDVQEQLEGVQFSRLPEGEVPKGP